MTILDIPYVSQEDEGADINGKEIYNDCGPTCGTMLIRAYTPDKTFTVNQFYDDLVGMGVKKKEGNTHRLNLQKVLEKHGISSSWNHSLKMSDLETSINEKRPPIALLNYKVFRQNGIKTYNQKAEWHFVVLVGIDESFVFLNDPLWPGTKGKNFQIPRGIWMEAWGGGGNKENMPFQAVIPTHPVDAEEMKSPEGSIRMKVIFDDFMNVRSGPDIKNDRLFKIDPGAYVTILESQTIGDDVWGKLGEDQWIAIILNGKTYLQPVAPAVDDPEDKSTTDQKEEIREENEMNEKQSVNGGIETKDDLSMENNQNLGNQTLGAILDELMEIKAILKDLKKNMASGDLEIEGQTDDEFISEEPISNTLEEPKMPEEPISSTPEEPEMPEEPKEPEVNFVEVFTDKQKGLVNLSFIKGTNNNKMPKFEIYPGDSKPTIERIYVKTGEKLKVIPGSRKVGDAGRTGWKLDKNEYIPRTKRSAQIPPGTDLYIEEKFIKSYIE